MKAPAKTRGGWTCAVCAHAASDEINAQLYAGVSASTVARRHNVALHSIYNHRNKHLADRVVSVAGGSAALVPLVEPRSLADEVVQQRSRADALGRRAESDNDVRTALLAIREWRGLVETQERLLARARAEEPSLADSEEWHELSGAILRALEAYPDAYQAVARAMREGVGRSTSKDPEQHPRMLTRSEPAPGKHAARRKANPPDDARSRAPAGARARGSSGGEGAS
jgi:hypothetical protein